MSRPDRAVPAPAVPAEDAARQAEAARVAGQTAAALAALAARAEQVATDQANAAWQQVDGAVADVARANNSQSPSEVRAARKAAATRAASARLAEQYAASQAATARLAGQLAEEQAGAAQDAAHGLANRVEEARGAAAQVAGRADEVHAAAQKSATLSEAACAAAQAAAAQANNAQNAAENARNAAAHAEAEWRKATQAATLAEAMLVPAAQNATPLSRTRSWIGAALHPSNVALDFADRDLSAPQLLLWANSAERDWYMQRRGKVYVFVLFALIALAVAAVFAQPGMRTATEKWWAWILTAVGVLILAYCTFPYAAARLAFREHRKKGAQYRAEMAADSLAENPELPLNQLFGMYRKQLDAYQEQTRRQQHAAFVVALTASAAGLAVLITGVTISLHVNPASDKYVVAGLTGLGALLSGFITRTFFRMSRRADRQLNRYYEEPHTTGQLLLAERLMMLYKRSDHPDVKVIINEAVKHLSRPAADGSTANPTAEHPDSDCARTSDV